MTLVTSHGARQLVSWGDAFGDDNEGEGGPYGGVSAGRDREAGGSVALRVTKQEKRRWKNRQKQGSSAKQSPGRKPGLGDRNGIAQVAKRLAMDSYL